MYEKEMEFRMKGMRAIDAFNARSGTRPESDRGMNAVQLEIVLESVQDTAFWREVQRIEKNFKKQ